MLLLGLLWTWKFFRIPKHISAAKIFSIHIHIKHKKYEHEHSSNRSFPYHSLTRTFRVFSAHVSRTGWNTIYSASWVTHNLIFKWSRGIMFPMYLPWNNKFHNNPGQNYESECERSQLERLSSWRDTNNYPIFFGRQTFYIADMQSWTFVMS
jgi:hypothetical protein